MLKKIGAITIIIVIGLALQNSMNQKSIENTQIKQVESKLTSHLEMGVVELLVNDLEKQRYFYENLVGLKMLDESQNDVTLGYEKRPIIKLVKDQNLSDAQPGSAGLYHTATVFENRSTLAQALLRILTHSPQLYTGSADHLVSEAFYFDDPEGNGVELYFDKDPSTWVWQNGRVEMDSLYIDIRDYIADYAQTFATLAKKIGHVHLKVGSIAEAKQFYTEVLGFRITAEMPTALFVSDGQYHHHLGMNVWESQGAGQRNPSLGLKSVFFILETKENLEGLINRLSENQVPYELVGEELTVSDPWLNQLIFAVKH